MTVGALTVVSVTEAGVAATLGAATATDGDSFDNRNKRGRAVIVVLNGSGGSITVSIPAQKTSSRKQGFGAVTKADAGGSVANGATKYFGPFDDCFEDANGKVKAICSAVSSVTVGVLYLPPLEGQA